jgi:hypothetical protein
VNRSMDNKEFCGQCGAQTLRTRNVLPMTSPHSTDGTRAPLSSEALSAAMIQFQYRSP